MRKFALVIIISLLFVGNVHTIAISEEPQIHEEFIIDFKDLKQIDNGNYLSLELSGTDDVFIQENYYIVPTKVETYTYPIGTTIESISIEPRYIQEKNIDKELQIAPSAKLTGSKESITSISSDSMQAQSISQWYTYNIGSGLVDGQRQLIVKIQLFPVQYIPDTNKINWAESFSININSQSPEDDYHEQSNVDTDLIILAPSNFISDLNRLVTHKINRGITTKLVTLNDIYNSIYFPSQGRDNQEKVKYFIKNAIE